MEWQADGGWEGILRYTEVCNCPAFVFMELESDKPNFQTNIIGLSDELSF